MKNFKKLREDTGLSQTELAQKLGVHYRTIQNWEKGTIIPETKVDFVENFFNEYKIRKHNNVLKNTTKTSSFPPEISVPKDELKKPIPYYNVDFAGGWNSDEIFSIGNPDFYINNPEFDRSEFACNLVGHSISRRIPNRAIIGLKLIEDWQTYFPTNELYGVVMKNELRTVKIVKRSKENKKMLILIPDALPEHNTIQYEPEEVPIEFISKFYQIVAWAQFERIAQ